MTTATMTVLRRELSSLVQTLLLDFLPPAERSAMPEKFALLSNEQLPHAFNFYCTQSSITFPFLRLYIGSAT